MIKLSFKNSEIILISAKQSDARWVVETLKSTGFHNELIWLKDESRTLDYLRSEGLYAGKASNETPKVYVVDPELESLEHVKTLVKEHDTGKDYQIINIEEAKKYLKNQREQDTRSYFGERKNIFNQFLTACLI
jgi:hypothetical protein